MPQSRPDNPRSQFGTNEWLVDEMYEQYRRDPGSVDQVWLDFFAERGDGNGTAATDDKPRSGAKSGDEAGAKSGDEAGAKSGDEAGAKSGDKAGAKSGDKAGAKSGDKAGAKSGDKSKVDKPKAKASQPKDGQPPTATRTDAEKPDKASSVSRAADSAEAPAASSAGFRPTPKEPAKPAKTEATNEPERSPLRGAAARTVTNMDASLAVPTATSVRSVPVKLLIDNRIVINNHLARARGGKVSFTHIIGFALVRALAAMPEMNRAYDVDDKGKPVLVTPAHVNLGLAIDVSKPDGTRQLLV
ncbi:MAG: 2-oxo acid dehydrogenase subunit E2, partial [Actinomycetota bacterium]|nr:2-oxo acid dehydrogenase subunit E2 [Actinomycetota bacterium]